VKQIVQNTTLALHGALLGTRNFGGFSSLHLAAQNGHNQCCREILLAGGDPDVQNNVSCSNFFLTSFSKYCF
jgi:ankyrin repeat domain-containing protein 6